MNREQLERALSVLRTVHSVWEVDQDVVKIQTGLQVRLGVLLAPEEAVLVWERFCDEHYRAGWTRVDDGVLGQCAQMLLGAYHGCLLYEERHALGL